MARTLRTRKPPPGVKLPGGVLPSRTGPPYLVGPLGRPLLLATWRKITTKRLVLRVPLSTLYGSRIRRVS